MDRLWHTKMRRLWSRGLVTTGVALGLLLGMLTLPAGPAVNAQVVASPVATGGVATQGMNDQQGQNGNDDAAPVEDTGDHGGDGPRNVVQVINKDDSQLRVKGKIQLNHINGQTVQPDNEATAYSSCVGCSTFAVALQIDLVRTDATTVAPQNSAVAVNYQCSGCTTVARAIQYVVPVDDPHQTPDNVQRLIRQMQQELNAAAHTRGETTAQAEARINTVIGQFQDLAQRLYSDNRDETMDGTTPGAAPMMAPTAGMSTGTAVTMPTGTVVITSTPATPAASGAATTVMGGPATGTTTMATPAGSAAASVTAAPTGSAGTVPISTASGTATTMIPAGSVTPTP